MSRSFTFYIEQIISPAEASGVDTSYTDCGSECDTDNIVCHRPEVYLALLGPTNRLRR